MGFILGGTGRVVFMAVVVCLGHATGVAWAKESSSPDSESKLEGGANADTPEKSDADLMYDAMKRSGQGSSNDAAIDRALARAQRDSEKNRKAMRQAFVARSWKDPFADNVAVPVRSRRTAHSDADELRAARAEAVKARRATAMARAEAAFARAETAQARANAARAEANAARADAVAARQACVALPARDDGARQAARKPYGDVVHASTKARFRATGRATPPSETSRRAVVPATLTVAASDESPPPSPPVAPARPLSGIIVVPIPPPSH